VEVYVNDMLVNSSKEDRHMANLEETIQTLHKYHMRLNSNKYVFGVFSRKFIGFIVSHHGIKANLEKLQAILHITPPRSRKEVQHLAGWVAMLS